MNNLKIDTLNPWIITGFTDAEGCFTVSIIPSNTHKNGYQIRSIFTINLNKKDLTLFW